MGVRQLRTSVAALGRARHDALLAVRCYPHPTEAQGFRLIPIAKSTYGSLKRAPFCSAEYRTPKAEMNHPKRQWGSHFRPRRGLLGLLLLANVLLALVLTVTLWLSYKNVLYTTDERATNTTIALERGLSGMLAQIDQLLVGGKYLLERDLATRQNRFGDH